MNVRAHMSMLFHLDKCIGCHTCSIACKNLWTDRRGAEYMWWNNVETRPGAGYPTQWEDQAHYHGGWRTDKGGLHLRLHSRPGGLLKIFYNPSLPSLDDYYEPFTFRYQDLFNAPPGDDQPTAIPISMVTGDPIDIQTGPNWDDDLGGSNIYAKNDLNMAAMPEYVGQQMAELKRVVFNYLPRICNHCLNPGCLAACPAGAIYKRAEDGVVLVNENKCRAWRMCVSGCPYKKVYYNWSTGKSEKCILCFPRLEVGQTTACSHSCVGRIRYVGVLLYDADRIPGACLVHDLELVAAHNSVILDPFDPEVLAGARANGIEENWISAAQKSPVYKFTKQWGLALPLHPEFRTMPMMFYVPPLSPVVSFMAEDLYKLDVAPHAGSSQEHYFELFDRLDAARMPVEYLASLLAAGNVASVRAALRKLLAVRTYKRRIALEGAAQQQTLDMLSSAGTNPEEAEAIYRLTALPTADERFVLPKYHRERSVEAWTDPMTRRGEMGFGYVQAPRRGE